MRNWLTLLCLLLASCAVLPTRSPPVDLFHDAAFVAPSEPVRAADIFAVSEPMRLYLRTAVGDQIRRKGTVQALIEALYKKGQLRLDYDASTTRTAAQAFDARAGNCLSLVVMTAAFARELGLQVRFNSAYLEEAVSRSSNFLLRSGHVNLSLGRSFADGRSGVYEAPLMIDFLPPEDLRGLRTSEISEDTVVAMFMNNRAVESLLLGRVDDAYWWARGAVVANPGFLGAVNTLGVVYLRHGDLQQAAAAFGRVLERDTENIPALSNLAKTLEQQGRADESKALYQRLAQIEPHPPFYYFDLGLAAMRKQDYRSARDLFAKEVARADYHHEFHFWLGLASYRLGDLTEARRELSLALENSTTQKDRENYAAKLNWLRSRSRQ